MPSHLYNVRKKNVLKDCKSVFWSKWGTELVGDMRQQLPSVQIQTE